jgi:uncharacterized protein (TIGR02594 family)
MKDLLFDEAFFKKRAPSYLTLIPIFILSVGHVYFAKEINILILTDLVILCAILFTLPQLNFTNQEENTHIISQNTGGYSILLLIVIPSSLFEFFEFFTINNDFFHVMTGITAAAFGVNKLNINRDNILKSVISYTQIKENVKQKAKESNATVSNTSTTTVTASTPPAPTKNISDIINPKAILDFNTGKYELPEEIKNIKNYFKPTNLAEAARIFIGTAEIKGDKHNPLILKFGKWAKIDWYTKDEIAWCAVFINAMLYLINKEGTKSALAKSFLSIGIRVTLTDVQKDPTNVVLIFHRGTRVTQSGHVEILSTINNKEYTSIGGNISDKVTYTKATLDNLRTKKLQDGTREFIEFRRMA